MRFWNYLACRLLRPRDYWHNRHFDARYQVQEEFPGKWRAQWKRQLTNTRSLADLVRLSHSPICHIFASGPSLSTLREPARLFNDFTICMNGSYRVAVNVGKPCNLFVTFDPGFVRRRFADFKEALPLAQNLLIDHLVFFLVFSQDPELGFRLNPFLYDDPNRPYLSRAVEKLVQLRANYHEGKDFVPDGRPTGEIISKSPKIGLGSSASVVCLALQAAWLMGFKEVRIYGMDLGGPTRFYKEAGKVEKVSLDVSYESHLLPWFTSFSKNFCGPDFRVFNCSESSRLPSEILPKLDPNTPVLT
jgi:hypothetical protein